MIESATETDLPEVRSVLERLGLPLEGVGDHLTIMLVAREDGRRHRVRLARLNAS